MSSKGEMKISLKLMICDRVSEENAAQMEVTAIIHFHGEDA
jgi:hypothetical protein